MKRLLSAIIAVLLLAGVSLNVAHADVKATNFRDGVYLSYTLQQYGRASFDPEGLSKHAANFVVEEKDGRVSVIWSRIVNDNGNQNVNVYISIAENGEWIIKGKKVANYTVENLHALGKLISGTPEIFATSPKDMEAKTKITISNSRIYIDYESNQWDSQRQKITQEISIDTNGNVVGNKLLQVQTFPKSGDDPYYYVPINTTHGKGLLIHNEVEKNYTIYLSDSQKMISFNDKHSVLPYTFNLYSVYADLNTNKLAYSTKDVSILDKVKQLDISTGEPIYDDAGKDKMIKGDTGYCIEQGHDGSIYICKRGGTDYNDRNYYVTLYDSSLEEVSVSVDTGINGRDEKILATSIDNEIHLWSLVEYKREQSLKLVAINKEVPTQTEIQQQKLDISSDAVNVKVNGQLLSFEQPPAIINDKTMVPMRKIFETLQATIKWDGDTQTVSGTKGNTTVILSIDSPVAKVNDSYVQLEQAPIIVNGSTMVPVRFISESLGAKVGWDGETRTVLIDLQ